MDQSSKGFAQLSAFDCHKASKKLLPSKTSSYELHGRKDEKSAEAFWTVPVSTFTGTGLEKERECPQSNMVSLLVDFGSFGPFLSPKLWAPPGVMGE